MSNLNDTQQELLSQYQAARAAAEAGIDGDYDQSYDLTGAQLQAADAFDASLPEDVDGWYLRHPEYTSEGN